MTTSGPPTHRKPPFLHRNWLSAMGSNIRQRDHEDDEHRPAKRRRVAANSPDSGIGLDGIEPVDEDGLHEKAMRIQVLKIVHKDSARVRTGLFGHVPGQFKDVSDSKARCRITISHDRNGVSQPLHVDSQICTVKAYKNLAGLPGMVRIHLPQPFNVPQEKFLVAREDDEVFGLADSYTAEIQLESAGDPNWPPEFLTSIEDRDRSFSILPRRQWVLQATIEDIFQCHRKTVELRLIKRHDHQPPTDYLLDLDVRWATGLSARVVKRLDKDIHPSITCCGEPDPMDLDTTFAGNGVNNVNGHANGFNGANGVNGHDIDGEVANGEHMDDVDDHTEGELTPGRIRRARPQINYNLKLLSDKAQKKERRGRLKGKPQNGALETTNNTRVTYHFREPLQMEDTSCFFQCAPALQSLPSFDLLCAHLRSEHDLSFEFDSHSRSIFNISRKPDHLRPFSPSKEFNLGQPVNEFDIHAYVEGDESWVTSRQVQREQDATGEQSVQLTVPKKVYDEMSLVRRGVPRKTVVPHTKTTLYHPLSKTPLEPGTEIERYTADEDWLIKKHRDCLDDYTDVSDNEKEYLKRWDAYILPFHLTSELYLPPHFVRFAKENACWIVAKASRRIEFCYHFQTLAARGVIDEPHIKTAMGFLNEAVSKEPEEEPAVPPKRSVNGCARCGKFVQSGPAWLACTQRDCPKPLYHDYCATGNTWPTDDRDNWKCNDCCL